MFTEIKSLNASSSIPKETLLFNNLNNNIAIGQFPDKLKFADVSPVFKKDCKTDKSNYRPVTLLLVISKVYERHILSIE